MSSKIKTKTILGTLVPVVKNKSEVASGKLNWTGEGLYFPLFFEYLNNKYTNCGLSRYSLYFNQRDLTYFSSKTVAAFSANSVLKNGKALADEYKGLSGNRFVVYPLTIGFSLGGGHANALIIDTKCRTAEVFEPYGNLLATIKPIGNFKPTDFHNEVLYYKMIKDNFLPALGIASYRLVHALDFLPEESLQVIEERKCLSNYSVYDINTNIGFCVIWTMFYIEQRLRFENKTRAEIVKGIMKYVSRGTASDAVCKVVRDYAGFVLKLYRDRSFAERLKIRWTFMKYVYLRRAAFLTTYGLLLFAITK